jgi:hypothetical protein
VVGDNWRRRRRREEESRKKSERAADASWAFEDWGTTESHCLGRADWNIQPWREGACEPCERPVTDSDTDR